MIIILRKKLYIYINRLINKKIIHSYDKLIEAILRKRKKKYTMEDLLNPTIDDFTDEEDPEQLPEEKKE